MGSSSSSLSSGSSSSSSSSSGSSSSCDAKHYGQWKDNQTCDCDQRYWKCYNIRHQGIRMADQMTEMYAAVFTTLTVGTNFIKHHCVKLRTQCENCGRVFYITAEHGIDAGVQLHHGFYQRELCVYQEQDVDISHASVYDVYQSLRHRTYNLIEYNCIHFAYEYYRAIIERNAAAL